MKKTLTTLFNIERSTALITWLIVSGSCLYLMQDSGKYDTQALAITAFLYVAFYVLFAFAIRDEPYASDVHTRLLMIAGQYLAVIGVYYQVPYSYTAILVTIWSAQLPYYMSIRTAVLLSPLWSAPMWLIYTYYWGHGFMFLNALLFWTFNLFAIVMTNARLKEQKAREAANEANRELLATQALLSEATKQAERVRIARNIHDLLGHHLTALTINLQVASRLSSGEAQEKIEQCHGLAKLLLSDVREAVSEIREKSNLQLKDALDSLIRDIPQINVQLNYQDDLKIDDVTMATAILRCVQESLTNSLKHSNADHFSIILAEKDNKLVLEMQDNGHASSTLGTGNGLEGIKERVMALGGKVSFSPGADGFKTNIELPEPV